MAADYQCSGPLTQAPPVVLAAFEQKYGVRPAEESVAQFECLVADELARNGLPPTFLQPAEVRQLALVGGAEFAPVAAVLAGILGQEVLKAVSKKGQPVVNVFVFEGRSGAGKEMRVGL